MPIRLSMDGASNLPKIDMPEVIGPLHNRPNTVTWQPIRLDEFRFERATAPAALFMTG